MKNYKSMNIADILATIENSFFKAEGPNQKIVQQKIKFKQLQEKPVLYHDIHNNKATSFSVDSSLFGFKNLKEKYFELKQLTLSSQKPS